MTTYIPCLLGQLIFVYGIKVWPQASILSFDSLSVPLAHKYLRLKEMDFNPSSGTHTQV